MTEMRLQLSAIAFALCRSCTVSHCALLLCMAAAPRPWAEHSTTASKGVWVVLLLCLKSGFVLFDLSVS